MSIHSQLDPNVFKLNYEDYLTIPNDGNRHEIIDGKHYMNPAPNLNHQTLSRRIQYQLYAQIEMNDLGWVFDAPVDVKLTDFDVVQPDVVVVLKNRKSILTETKIDGTPNLIIEILSRRTANYDRQTKKKLYQLAGVSEYWLVDPDQKSIEQLVLQEGSYQLQARGEQIQLTIMTAVTVNTVGLWD